MSTSPFAAIYESYGKSTAIPSAYLESLAFNESTEKPETPGGGLFQITPPVLTDYNRLNRANYTAQDLADAAKNTQVAVWHLRRIIRSMKHEDWADNDWIRALTMAWNMGSSDIPRALNSAPVISWGARAAGEPTAYEELVNRIATGNYAAKRYLNNARLEYIERVLKRFHALTDVNVNPPVATEDYSTDQRIAALDESIRRMIDTAPALDKTESEIHLMSLAQDWQAARNRAMTDEAVLASFEDRAEQMAAAMEEAIRGVGNSGKWLGFGLGASALVVGLAFAWSR